MGDPHIFFVSVKENLFIMIYSIQYKYIMEIKITKQTKSCGEGDNQPKVVFLLPFLIFFLE